jgi:ubiquinone biosynthesis protein UbiJ
MTTIAGSMASGSIPWAFWPGPRLSTPVRYRFVVTGPVPYRTTLVVAGDHVDLEEAGDAAVDVTFHCDTETFVLLISARLTLESALDNGRVIVEGDRSLAMAFSQWFKGV